LAGLALGFSSAVRVVAPLIGVVVLGYILLSRKWRLLPRVVAYGLIAICFMILFWPYLWPDALGRLLQSISISASFPNVHIVLFKGVLFNASDIPNSYVPVLLLVQLTETTLLLILVGAFALLKKVRWDFVALVVVWFVLPVAVMILAGVNLYNNLRQEFFIFPPLFLMAGLGLDWLLRLVRRPAIQCLVIFLCVLPGLYANVTLYPYQYIYYNQLVGGISGAYRNYELDYWGLAIKDAQDYVNQNAGKAANIYVDKTKHAAQIFARPDLVFNAFGGKNWKSYDFIVVSTAQNSDERFAAFQTVFVVERDGVPLAYVKKP
jgi:MFS family permease